jgi:hypothetical protein
MIVAVIKLAIEDNSGDTNNDEQSICSYGIQWHTLSSEVVVKCC